MRSGLRLRLMMLFYTWNTRQPDTWGGSIYQGKFHVYKKNCLYVEGGWGVGGLSFQKINGNNGIQDFVLVLCRVFVGRSASVPSQHA